MLLAFGLQRAIWIAAFVLLARAGFPFVTPIDVASQALADSRAGPPRIPYYRPIEGESGSGKELAARAIHQLSARRERRSCDVNCAAIPEELLDSELFGHARGAFTAANREMRTESAEGRFRQDLLYRLDVIRIRVPPLRDRPEDVAVLAEHFWRDATSANCRT